jgi:hypothetical protein
MGNEAVNVTPSVTPDQAIPGTPSAPPKAPGTEISDDKGGTKPKPVADEVFEMKVNGKVRKMTKDEYWAARKDIGGKVSLADAAYEKFEEASKKEKKYGDWKAKAAKNVIEALQDPELGLSRDQIREQFEAWYKSEFIDPETMTEDQRELAKYKKEAEEARADKKKREDEEKSKSELAQEQAVREEMQKQIIGCIEKSGMPKTRFVAGRLAYWQKQNLAKGYDAPDDVLIQQVKDERQAIVRQDIETMTPEQVVETFGDEIIKKLRQYDLARLNKRFGGGGDAPPIEKKDGANGKRTMADVDNYLNSLRRSKVSRRE